MSTNYHTAVAAGASATAATVESPIAQIDGHLNPTIAEYANTGDTSTTVTTAGTYYAVASHEVSFTPAFAGQVFEIALVLGLAYASAAGYATFVLRITDGSGTTVVDSFILGRTDAATTSASNRGNIAGTRSWTAGAGDLGVTRKAKLYCTHTVNGTAVHDQYASLQARYR